MRFGFAKKTGISAFLSAMLVLAPHVWAETFTAKVVGVSDGDTVKVLTEQSCDTGKDCRSGKIQYRVRLAEIDTPEKKQPYGSKAKQALSDLVFGRMIKVVRIPVNLNSDSGICEHHFRKVCGQGFCEQKLSFEGRHLFDSPNKPAAKRSAAVVDPGHWSMTVHLTSEFVL